jgi:hypothetical protein
VTLKAGLDPKVHAVSCTAGDYDNDGATDLAVALGAPGILLLHNEKNGTFKDMATAEIHAAVGSVWKVPRFAPGLAFVDYDHDGDLDLLVTIDTSPPMWSEQAFSEKNIPPATTILRNNGDQTFTDVTESLSLSAGRESAFAIATDYNNDRAVDLVLTGFKDGPIVFQNPREGAFEPRRLWSGKDLAQTVGVAVLDFNHDGWMDLAFTHWGRPGFPCGETTRAKRLTRFHSRKWIGCMPSASPPSTTTTMAGSIW